MLSIDKHSNLFTLSTTEDNKKIQSIAYCLLGHYSQNILRISYDRYFDRSASLQK
jgi:hypothetical protein